MLLLSHIEEGHSGLTPHLCETDKQIRSAIAVINDPVELQRQLMIIII